MPHLLLSRVYFLQVPPMIQSLTVGPCCSVYAFSTRPRGTKAQGTKMCYLDVILAACCLKSQTRFPSRSDLFFPICCVCVCVCCVFVGTDVDRHTCTQGGPGLISLEIILYCSNILFTEVGSVNQTQRPPHRTHMAGLARFLQGLCSCLPGLEL